MNKSSTLRGQFIKQILVVMILIGLVTGSLQIWLMFNSIGADIDDQAEMISGSIQQGIKETDMAATAIEHQIDLKLESYSRHIADKLRGKSIEEISNGELERIRDELDLAGITLFVQTKDDIVGARATDPKEIGFSIKSFNPAAFEIFKMFANGQKLPPEGEQMASYLTDTTINLFISQSGSHDQEMKFFKYGYHKDPNIDFIIDPYIEADEVYKFIQNVGPDAWISQVLEQNANTLEIAVLDPRVFADPSLAESMYPPLSKVVNGEYTLASELDTQTIMQMSKEPSSMHSYEQTIDGKKTYKVFLPIREGRVLYIALDYGKMALPFYWNALMMIVFGLVALVALILLTTRFFNRNYVHIQQIIRQIGFHESGDFTVRNEVKDKGELGSLSVSTNKMADSLNHVLTETFDKALQAQRLSYLLEAEANQSVEQVYAMSMEKTAESRDSAEEAYAFLDLIEEMLKPYDHPKIEEALKGVAEMRSLVKIRTNHVTDITLALYDLLKSLHNQSSELSELAGSLLRKLENFKLDAR